MSNSYPTNYPYHQPEVDDWDDYCNEWEEDAEVEKHGGIDKCMNCGKYKYNDQLNAFQVCIKACRNPNEY